MSKRMVSQGVVALLIGSLGISDLASKARFDTHATADIAMLIATGICIGTGLIMCVQASRRV